MSQSLNTSTSLNAIAYPRTGKRGVPQQFPRKLYKMLQSESDNSSPDIISWSESGKAFRISDISIFSSLVLPMYFRTSKFSSFQRNLNLYGFHKIRRGPDTDMYAHPAFLRGRPELLSQLKKSTHSSADKTRPTPKQREFTNTISISDNNKHTNTNTNTITNTHGSQHTKENVQKCEQELTLRMVSPYSSRDELQQHIFATNGHECSRILQNYKRDFHAKNNQTQEIKSNFQFTGGDRYFHKAKSLSSMDDHVRDNIILSQQTSSGTSTHSNEFGRLALLAVVMSRLEEQD